MELFAPAIIGAITVWYYLKVYRPSQTKITPRAGSDRTYSTEKKCRSCAMMIPADAVKCPYCRATVGLSSMGKVIAGLFILMVISVVIGQVSSTPKTVDKAPPTAQEIEHAQSSAAKYAAKEFVERTLKAPSTAKFQYYDDFAAAKQKDGSWQVMGYVDAQNSFGAMLRQQFLCTLKKEEGRWTLIDIKMPY